MKRVVLILIAGMLTVALVPGGAHAARKPKAKKTVRIVTDKYDAPSIRIAGQSLYSQCSAPTVGCTEFTGTARERYVSFEVKDASGLPALAQVRVGDEPVATFCGYTELPIEIPAKAKIKVVVESRPVLPITLCGVVTSVPTTGDVIATFSNRL